MTKFKNFEELGSAKGIVSDADYSNAMFQRKQQAKNIYHTTERLSAEPRGNEVDLRRKP